jgi:hypothetical protein
MAQSRTFAAFLAGLFAAILFAYLAPLLPTQLDDSAMSAPLFTTISRARSALQNPLASALRPFTPLLAKPAHIPAARTFNSTASVKMTTKMSFAEAVHYRRSIYQLNKNAPIPDSRIEEIARAAIKDVPSSFNSQSARMVILLKDDHDKFWDVVKDILKAIVPADSWSHTEQRVNGFRAGYGTVCISAATKVWSNGADGRAVDSLLRGPRADQEAPNAVRAVR